MQDTRLSKQTVSTRKSKASHTRQVTEDRQWTDADRLELFRAAAMQSALPDIPPIPGFHVVWLSSNNPRDTIQMRMRLGYVPVANEDVKGFEFVADKGGATDGLIRVNEMVAFKLPIELYNVYMLENHHYAPAREETKLTDAVTKVKKSLQAQGSDVDEGDGVDALRELDSIRPPSFLEDT